MDKSSTTKISASESFVAFEPRQETGLKQVLFSFPIVFLPLPDFQNVRECRGASFEADKIGLRVISWQNMSLGFLLDGFHLWYCWQSGCDSSENSEHLGRNIRWENFLSACQESNPRLMRERYFCAKEFLEISVTNAYFQKILCSQLYFQGQPRA